MITVDNLMINVNRVFIIDVVMNTEKRKESYCIRKASHQH